MQSQSQRKHDEASLLLLPFANFLQKERIGARNQKSTGNLRTGRSRAVKHRSENHDSHLNHILRSESDAPACNAQWRRHQSSLRTLDNPDRVITRDTIWFLVHCASLGCKYTAPRMKNIFFFNTMISGGFIVNKSAHPFNS